LVFQLTKRLPSAKAEKPGDEDVFRELGELLRRVPKVRLNPAALFALSLMLFVALGVVGSSSSLAGMVCLVAVLALHEAGHALAMRLFGYQDVRIFFVPFLGAATAGRKTLAPVWQQAVVLLAGPVPGLLLGLLLRGLDPPWLSAAPELAPLLIGLNALNLIPVDPLDGGRLAGLLLFGERDKLRILVSTALAVTFTVLLRLEAVLQGAIVGAATATQLERWRVATLAERLRRSPGLAVEALPADLESATEPTLRELLAAARTLENKKTRGSAKLLAGAALGRMRLLIEMLRARPIAPGVAVPVALAMFVGTLHFGKALAAMPPAHRDVTAAQYDSGFLRSCKKACPAEAGLCARYCQCVLDGIHGAGDREASTRWLRANLDRTDPTPEGQQRATEAQHACADSIRRPAQLVR